jgi:hypothetical protein
LVGADGAGREVAANPSLHTMGPDQGLRVGVPKRLRE